MWKKKWHSYYTTMSVDRVEEVLSPSVNINCGVPQGSPLSCEDAKGVLDFFKANQLFANPSKTAFLTIEPGQDTIKIGNERIHESNVENILGVKVDNKLTWDDHFKKVNKKVNYGISTLRQIHGLVGTQTKF